MLWSRGKSNTKKPQSRQRNSGQGATRKTVSESKPTRSFAWVNYVLVFVGAGVVLTALVKAAMVLQAIPVERIVVKGKLEHTRRLALEEMVQPALVGGFLGADLEQIQRQLERLPWVYRASVKRQWPSALEIHVLEQLPIARWGESGFLNHEGEVFHTSSAASRETLPMLAGPQDARQKLIAQYQVISDRLLPVELTIQALTVDQRGQLRATLVGNMELVFGDEDLLERLDRFIALYRASLRERRTDISRVDLRYHSGIAVAFREPPEIADL